MPVRHKAADQLLRARAEHNARFDADRVKQAEEVVTRERQVEQDVRIVSKVAQADAVPACQTMVCGNDRMRRQFGQRLGQ